MAVAYRIDDVGPADLDRVMEIEAYSFITPWHRDSLAGALERSRSLFLAAREDNEMVGYALSWLVADELHILKVAVDRYHRRQGWGSRILNETIRRAKENGVVVVWLEVRPSNKPALAMYQSCGFKKAFTRKKYYTDTGEDAVILVRDLKEGV